MYVDPTNYRLSPEQYQELNKTLLLAEASALSDLAIYNSHPDWFKRTNEGEIIYTRSGPYRALPATRKLGVDEDPEHLLEEMTRDIRPRHKEFMHARDIVRNFFTTATHVMNAREALATEVVTESGLVLGAKDKTPFWYYLGEIESAMADVRALVTIIPETCIETCEHMTEALQGKTTNKAVVDEAIVRQWQEKLLNTTRQVVSLGAGLA